MQQKRDREEILLGALAEEGVGLVLVEGVGKRRVSQWNSSGIVYGVVSSSWQQNLNHYPIQ